MQAEELFEKASNKLPMVPKVIQELIASFQRTDIAIDEIVNKVGHDQVLTARVLRLANSARFGGCRNVGSLDKAVMLLGLDNLRILVIASSLTVSTAGIPGVDMKAFWHRSFTIASLCKLLAQHANLQPQLCYTCGLLSNIGQLVFYVACPEQSALHAAGSASPVSVTGVELGLAEVGAELARRWSFPVEIQAAIAQQHQAHAEVSKYALIIGLANKIAAGFEQSLSDQAILDMLPNSTMALVGLNCDTIQSLMADLKTIANQKDALF